MEACSCSSTSVVVVIYYLLPVLRVIYLKVKLADRTYKNLLPFELETIHSTLINLRSHLLERHIWPPRFSVMQRRRQIYAEIIVIQCFLSNTRSKRPPLPFHSLRHTCALLLLEAGADIKFVQEQLGHGSVQITSDVYAHISKKLEKRNIDKYEEYTSRIFGSENQKPGDVWGTQPQ